MENSSKTITFCLQNLLFHSIPCLLVVIQNLAVAVRGDFQVTPYNPQENIPIDCGSSEDGKSIDLRYWFGDRKEFSVIEHQYSTNKSLVINATAPLPSSVDVVPYSTARLSYSEFTYSIPLTTAGPKFIRLYFYPTSYQGFEHPSNKDFFSVKAASFTLLKNFSASLQAGDKLTLIKEFCVNVDGQRLNLTFTPNSDSYAFINGIEVVSMPTTLYYKASGDEGVPFIGQARGIMYPIEKDTAFEKMYRVNVGGEEISPGADTGMFRGWLKDDAYLTTPKPRTYSVPFNASVNLTFSTVPSFSAPRDVYVTARSLDHNTVDQNYLIWEFAVESGFNYFVRLHFCEFEPEITKLGDRIFEIFLANSTADTVADVITWSGGNGIPVYEDYVVAIGMKGYQKHQNLSIALYPAPAWRTLYSDVILNGLEIFKLSNNLDLTGPIDPLKPPIVQSRKKRTTVVVVVASIFAFFVASLLLFLIFRKYSNKFSNNTNIRPPPSYICRPFSLREIKTATNNFDKSFIIGRGGFGDVYKGFTNAEDHMQTTSVAIKRLNPSSQQGVLEFRTEIEMLSKLRHKNLVSLIGYCEDNKEMILVYDYMIHGTLRGHLYNTNNPPLEWEQRLKMCIGAAHGLHYLHRGPNHTIIHRDVKTTNILISEKWEAKVSDFGLSKMNDLSNTHISTAVKGSFGYLDPEYYRLQKLTEKSDVYSFGVVLCEVLCARAPLDRNAEDHMQISLADWVQHCYNNESLSQIIDPYLQDKICIPSLIKFSEVAISCLASEGTKRPGMSDVVSGLELALQLQASEMNGNHENHVNYSSAIDYHVLFTSGSGSMRVGR